MVVWSVARRALVPVVSMASAVGVGVVGIPSAHADSVEPFKSDYGNIEVFTTPASYVGVEVNNLRLKNPSTQGCSVGVRTGNDYVNLKSASLNVSDDGHGKAYVGPLVNGTQFVMITCDGPAADGKFVGGRGPYTLGNSPIFIDLPAYSDDHPMSTIVVHMNGTPTRPKDYPPLTIPNSSLDSMNPTRVQPMPDNAGEVNDMKANMDKGDDCINRVSSIFGSLPSGTEAALETMKKVPKNASTFAMAACSFTTLLNSRHPGSDQEVFNSICKTLENALDPLGVGEAKDFFCGTPAG